MSGLRIAADDIPDGTSRTEVEATARSLRILIDSFPARRTGQQQEVYDEWLLYRQRLTDLDHYSRPTQVVGYRNRTRLLIRQAEVSGKRVEASLIGWRLLNELHRVYRECVTAFDSLKTALGGTWPVHNA